MHLSGTEVLLSAWMSSPVFRPMLLDHSFSNRRTESLAILLVSNLATESELPATVSMSHLRSVPTLKPDLKLIRLKANQ